jgi:hypothetical protein
MGDDESISLRPVVLKPQAPGLAAGSNPFASFGKGAGFGIKAKKVCCWAAAALLCWCPELQRLQICERHAAVHTEASSAGPCPLIQTCLCLLHRPMPPLECLGRERWSPRRRASASSTARIS